ENTIIDGSFRRELREYKSPEYQLNTLYKNCMIRIPNSLPSFVQVILNQNPQFKDRTELDFRLKSNSPAIDAGVPNGVLFDILGNPRVGIPDIGAYEFTE
ncbi:MAG TPA: choice-of-anchor Q domain-containing protein, partial [Bacteroidales bacterium]|nr:choice-of-anchor Q domain-containing protein [Bacteroidales bacterium]